jgi:hypothetical protein
MNVAAKLFGTTDETEVLKREPCFFDKDYETTGANINNFTHLTKFLSNFQKEIHKKTSSPSR